MSLDYYNQGWEAYYNGLDMNDCPFQQETVEEFDWKQGFTHAEQYENS